MEFKDCPDMHLVITSLGPIIEYDGIDRGPPHGDNVGIKDTQQPQEEDREACESQETDTGLGWIFWNQEGTVKIESDSEGENAQQEDKESQQGAIDQLFRELDPKMEEYNSRPAEEKPLTWSILQNAEFLAARSLLLGPPDRQQL